jgi:hypothetical protein
MGMQDGNNRTVRAVLTGALQESDGTTYNVATQMNSFVYNTVVGWCASHCCSLPVCRLPARLSATALPLSGFHATGQSMPQREPM